MNLNKIIIYEDEYVIVVNKPCGLLTISDGNNSQNVYSYLYKYCLEKENKHLFVVHRLDKYTSGLIIFAKSNLIKEKLQKCFEEKRVIRLYEALAIGNSIKKGEVKKIEINVFEDKNNNVFVSKDNRGKKCITFVKCLDQNDKYSLLDISILTGRRNQIRLSLSEIGMPILGDSKYGIKCEENRMYLNAYKLEFPKDIGIKKYCFEIPKIFSLKSNN